MKTTERRFVASDWFYEHSRARESWLNEAGRAKLWVLARDARREIEQRANLVEHRGTRWEPSFFISRQWERRGTMTFEEYWKEVEKTGILARVAIRLLPNSFSNELKDMLVEMDPEDVATKCQRAINEINRGSVVSLETLIRRQL